jgi:putative spermidine/putrescine transport system substrate-binding protein
MMQRRTFLGLTALSTFSVAAPAVVRAQGKRFEGVTLNLNGYGGDYNRLLTEYVAKPLEARTGLKVSYQSGTVQSAVAKLIASRENPPFDLIMADSPNIPELIKNDIIEPVSAAEVPNIRKLLPKVREFGDYGVPFLTNSVILTYNTKLVKEPIASYTDLARPDLKDRVGLLTPENTGGLLSLIAFGESNGGGLDNMEPAFKALAAMRSNISTVTPATVNLLQLFEQEEVWAGPFFDGRTYSMRAKGKPMATVVPKEGVYSLFNYLNPVKGAGKREAMLAYIEQALSDEAVGPLVDFFRYGPCTDIKLSEAVSKDVVLSGATRDRMKPVDWAKVAEKRGAWAADFNRAMR